MTTTLNFKDQIDLPEWRPLSPQPTASGAGTAMTGDLRGSENRDPHLYYLASNVLFYKYNTFTDEWLALASPALAGTFGAGADAVLAPDKGPSGTISAGTTTSVTLSTALPAGVGTNQLANRGDGQGYRIKIIGNRSGGSGLIETRKIVGNTSGTTPIIYLDSPLTFTPANGDGYDILSGRVYLLGAGTTASGSFKHYDIATNSYGTLANTNLPASITTDSHMVVMSETHVPHDMIPGEGLIIGTSTYDGGGKRCLVATATAAGTLTGHSSGGDSTVLANEYRNFQIRIVGDTAIPTAVGQVRKISSHTAGASPVYTLASNWTVTPSSTAKYVIEYDSDKILLFTTAATTVYNYNVTANTWDTSTWAARGNAVGAGVCGQFGFGIPRDTSGRFRHSYLFSPRGGASTAIDMLDIAGAATGSWSAAIMYGNYGQTFTTGTCGVYNPMSQDGRYYYLNVNGTNRNARFDMLNRVLEPYGFIETTMGTAAVGRRIALSSYHDGAIKIAFLHVMRAANVEMYQNLIWR